MLADADWPGTVAAANVQDTITNKSIDFLSSILDPQATMFLLDFPKEMLDNIFSSLRQHNFYALSLCSHNSHDVILPYLYREIEFMIRPLYRKPVWGNDERIDSFIACLKSHPERARWTTTASITWSEKEEENTRVKIFWILEHLPSLHTLKMKAEEIETSCGLIISRGGTSPSRASRLLCQIPSFRFLRNLTIDDSRISIDDIARVLSIPALRELTIVGFREEPRISQFQYIEAPPASNVQTLKFQKLWQPSKKSISRLLTHQTQLKSLTLEICCQNIISPIVSWEFH